MIIDDGARACAARVRSARRPAPTPLAEGDLIGIGTAVLTFLRRGGTGSTETA